jgi:5-methylcytosine-specific restriction endonuclease McrA
MTRTYQIFRHQHDRAKKAGRQLDYDLEDLRTIVEKALMKECPYCLQMLNVQNFSCDHEVPVSRGGSYSWANVVVCCKNCNEAKGPLLGDEFVAIMGLLLTFPMQSKLNVIRRLRAGGRLIHSR